MSLQRLKPGKPTLLGTWNVLGEGRIPQGRDQAGYLLTNHTARSQGASRPGGNSSSGRSVVPAVQFLTRGQSPAPREHF